MIKSTIQVGEPTECRGIVVAPLYPRSTPTAAYTTLEVALGRGFAVTETSSLGTVPELRVVNPLDEAVLLYDGEELVGAKQDRILNVSVLVAAGSTLAIPVSCVEAGRWSPRSEKFGAARHLTSPEVRERKNRVLADQPMVRGYAQSEVWSAVADKAARLHAPSETGAQGDLFRSREGELGGLRAAFPLQPGQSGALLVLGDRGLCLDYVSRPDAFATLYPKLLDGYLLDALDWIDRPAAKPSRIEAFLTALGDTTVTRRPSEGLGDDVRLAGAAVHGSGLELDGEPIQLSAFLAARGQGRPGRIARPSNRG